MPRFQRKLRWKASDVCLLFDSIYRGYPIGTLLMWSRPTEAGTQAFGPLAVAVSSREDALWLVDGQQRVTSLIAALRHPRPDPSDRDDPYVVFFDLEKQSFRPAPGSAPVPNTWLPLHRMGNATEFQRWLFDWVSQTGQHHHLDLAQRVATRLRNYRVPIYVVEDATEREVREIFHRVNAAGKRMRAHEVFDALVGSGGTTPDRIDELADRIEAFGFGRLDPDLLQQCALAIRDLDVTRRIDEQGLGDYQKLAGVVRDLQQAIRLSVDFLIDDAHIPHARVLPYRQIPVITLARFFHLFPDPDLNARRLMIRWVWRGMMTGKHASADRTYLRKCPKDVREGAEGTALRLLKDVPRISSWEVREKKFDARFAGDRVAVLALATLSPRALGSGLELDVADALDTHGNQTLQRIVPRGAGHVTAANRIIAPGLTSGEVRAALMRADRDVLDSHAISQRALQCLIERDFDGFLATRRTTLVAAVGTQAGRFAEWEHASRRTVGFEE